MPRPKIADIARETGLTIGTVSRALDTSGKYAVAAKTRDRVLEVAHRLGYRPHLIGRALASGSSKLILLLTPNPFGPYYVEINRHLADLARGRGYEFLVPSTLPMPGESISMDDWLYGADGLVVCDGMTAWAGHVSEAIRLKVPVVGMGMDQPTFPADLASVDLTSGARSLTEHMLEVGCRTPALLATPRADQGDARYRAYMETAQRFGFPPRILEAPHQTREASRKVVAEAYAQAPFDGLQCENDLMAMGALRGLCDLGIRVPEDVRLAGCDGLEESSFQIVPITTLVQPIEEMCQTAWEMLQARIDGDASPRKSVVLSAKLEIRASTLSRL